MSLDPVGLVVSMHHYLLLDQESISQTTVQLLRLGIELSIPVGLVVVSIEATGTTPTVVADILAVGVVDIAVELAIHTTTASIALAGRQVAGMAVGQLVQWDIMGFHLQEPMY